ncbi:MAG: hypothetical protein J6J13_06740 [Clostridia bacterium]|nr:hypothetical protein [Clostridia bacterium]
MPDYRKKRIGFKKKNNKKTSKIDDNIKMESNDSKQKRFPKSNIKVVKGKKLERIRRFKIYGAIALFLVLAYLILSLIAPVSIGENITNLFALVGSGSYPKEIYGAKTLNAVSKGSYYYVLTDTDISAFSNSGKEVYTYSHGYSNPVMATSSTRAMVYDQNGTSLKIFNLKEQTNSLTTKKAIICAAISRNGSYAVVTQSDEYASTVTVYNRKDKKIYEWNSAKDKVNSIAINSSGDKIAVSTANAYNGSHISNVYVLNFKDGKEYSSKIENGLVYGIYDTGKAFSVVSSKGYSYITWSKHEKQEINSDLSLSMYRQSSKGVLLVFNRENDVGDNTIILLSKKGEKIIEFQFQGIISDIQFSDGHIYCISESKVYLFDNDGKLLGSSDCDYDAVRIVPQGSHSMVTITDSSIKKLVIKN